MKLDDALEVVCRTDPGMIRSHNEDAVFADGALGIAILADGMGGYNAGEVASGMATTLLSTNFARFLPTFQIEGNDRLNNAFAERYLTEEANSANAAIFNAAQSQPQYAGMGTTLVIAWFYDNRMSVLHVGDSRLYRLRDEQLEQLTRDQSNLADCIDEMEARAGIRSPAR